MPPDSTSTVLVPQAVIMSPKARGLKVSSQRAMWPAMRGSSAARITAAIGPAISAANYEVGPDFVAALLAQHPGAAVRISRPAGGREHFDLPGFVADRLRDCGVTTVDDLGLCTYAAPDRFFSHRYATHQGTVTGRQLALIGLS